MEPLDDVLRDPLPRTRISQSGNAGMVKAGITRHAIIATSANPACSARMAMRLSEITAYTLRALMSCATHRGARSP